MLISFLSKLQIWPSNKNSWFMYVAIVALTGLMTLFIYQWLPSLGMEKLASVLTMPKIYLLLIAIIGVSVYSRYVQYVKYDNPFMLLLIFCFGLPLISFINSSLIRMGINFRWNQLTALFLWTPVFFYCWPALKAAMKRIPFFNGVFLFSIVFFIYFLFFNAHAVVIHIALTPGGSYRTLDMDKAYNIFTIIFGIISIAYAAGRFTVKEKIFDQLNKIIVYAIIISSVIIIIGYPFDFLTMLVEGYKRSKFIYSHPNQLGHSLGFFLLYLFSLRFYYLKKAIFFVKYFDIAIILGLLALLLTFSKTAIVATLLSAAIFIGAYLFFISFDTRLIKTVITATISFVFLLIVIQFTGVFDIWGTLQARAEDSGSLYWRFKQWQSLLYDFNNWFSYIFGHGLTASSARIFQLNYNNGIDPSRGDTLVVGIHNGYLDSLYDFGLLGCLWLLGLLNTLWVNVKLLLSSFVESSKKIVVLSVTTVVIYALIGCFFDELLYSMLYPFLFITSATYMLCLHLPEEKERIHQAKQGLLVN